MWGAATDFRGRIRVAVLKKLRTAVLYNATTRPLNVATCLFCPIRRVVLFAVVLCAVAPFPKRFHFTVGFPKERARSSFSRRRQVSNMLLFRSCRRHLTSVDLKPTPATNSTFKVTKVHFCGCSRPQRLPSIIYVVDRLT